MKSESEHIQFDKTRPTQIAREVACLARSIFGDNVEVLWFGSWPKGNARAHSDIDLAISTGAPIPLERMRLLLDAVEELPTLYQVDIVDLCAVGSVLREEILKYGEHL
jgi:predicted nucleotidyltransferase